MRVSFRRIAALAVPIVAGCSQAMLWSGLDAPDASELTAKRAIDLDGGERVLKSVEFWYDANTRGSGRSSLGSGLAKPFTSRGQSC